MIFIDMIQLQNLLIETFDNKIDELPTGKLFNDAKNIESIFNKSRRSWSDVIEAFEKNKDNGRLQLISLKDIHITQPNIQSNKVKTILSSLNKLSTINVVEFEDGEMAIFDGHHRLVANWALGNSKIEVNLVQAKNSNTTKFDWTGIDTPGDPTM
jgi:hypothetical protein